MKELFFNNTLFRLIAPPVFGVVLYVLILMFFDSIDMLLENFFSQELVFVITLTFLFFELQRLLIVLLNKLVRFDNDPGKRIWIQFSGAILLTLIGISVALRTYFVYVEGFTTIKTELITFNGVYLLVTFFYHLFFFSLIYLHRKNQKKIQKELVLKENLDLEYESFKNQINPDLLFTGLELVIATLSANKEEADALIYSLSKIYRYTLDNQNNDLVSLQSEFSSLHALKHLYSCRFGDSFKMDVITDETQDLHLIPGSIQIILELITSRQIISSDLPLVVTIETIDDNLKICFKSAPRLRLDTKDITSFNNLDKAYKYYISKGIQKTMSNGVICYSLPMFTIENE